jgi:hypothetical protein
VNDGAAPPALGPQPRAAVYATAVAAGHPRKEGGSPKAPPSLAYRARHWYRSVFLPAARSASGAGAPAPGLGGKGIKHRPTLFALLLRLVGPLSEGRRRSRLCSRRCRLRPKDLARGRCCTGAGHLIVPLSCHFIHLLSLLAGFPWTNPWRSLGVSQHALDPNLRLWSPVSIDPPGPSLVFPQRAMLLRDGPGAGVGAPVPNLQFVSYTRSSRRRCCTSCRCRCAPACSCRIRRRLRPRSPASGPWRGGPG